MYEYMILWLALTVTKNLYLKYALDLDPSLFLIPGLRGQPLKVLQGPSMGTRSSRLSFQLILPIFHTVRLHPFCILLSGVSGNLLIIKSSI